MCYVKKKVVKDKITGSNILIDRGNFTKERRRKEARRTGSYETCEIEMVYEKTYIKMGF